MINPLGTGGSAVNGYKLERPQTHVAGPLDSVSVGTTVSHSAGSRPKWKPLKQGLEDLKAQLERSEALGIAPLNGPVAATLEKVLADESPTEDLRVIADRAMAKQGLAIDFPPAVMAEVNAITGPAKPSDARVRDLRHLKMVSIDNGDLDPVTRELKNSSQDIDQLSHAEKLPNGNTRVRVAIADVESLAPRGSATHQFAMHNSRTVYTDDKIYPMIPERFSTDLTSLDPGQDRLAVVKEFEVTPDGQIVSEDMYEAFVHNHAKMAYDSVAEWLDGKGVTPPPLENAEIAEQVRLQDDVSRALEARRFEGGAVDIGSRETRARIENGEVLDLEPHVQTRAHKIIENLMIAANGVTVRFLEERGYPTFRRIVKIPEKWDKMRAIAEARGDSLPHSANSKALNEFLQRQRKADPLRFPDLSLDVVKALGRGEYAVSDPRLPDELQDFRHFALAVISYGHSTAPNRRGPDLALQVIEKAAIRGEACPYSPEELQELAQHFTKREEEVNKAERQVNKSAAAKLLKPRVGETFEGIVSNQTEQGTWVRLLDPPVEGKLVKGGSSVEKGDEVKVTLDKVDVAKGWIDLTVER